MGLSWLWRVCAGLVHWAGGDAVGKAKLGVSYFGVRNPDHVAADVRRMVEAGCNVIVHTFSEEDLQFYRETMQDIVALSKGYGLEVYLDPWGVGGVFGGEAFTRFALEHDEARQVLANGAKAPAACPNSPVFRDFMRQWIKAAVEVGADVLFWDEPHFFLPAWHGLPPELWACRCPACQDLFLQEFAHPLPQALTPEVREFQEHSLYLFLKELTAFAQSLGVRNALCLLPEWEDPGAAERRWEKFAALESIDVFGTDPYWLWAGRSFSEFEFFAQTVKRLAERFGKEPQIWVQACKVRAGQEPWIRQAVRAAYQLGIRNILAWSYLGTAYMSWVRSDRPDKVWAELVQAFQAIRSAESKAPDLT